MFLSFWKVSLRTVTVFDYSFQSVTAFRLEISQAFLTIHRSWPFTVPDRYHDRSWPFLSVSWPFLSVINRFLSVFDCFLSVFNRFMTFFCVYGRFFYRLCQKRFFIVKVKSDRKRSETVMKRSGTLRNGERSYCTRSRSEAFTKSRSRYGHAHASKMKSYCTTLITLITVNNVFEDWPENGDFSGRSRC